MRDSVYNGRLPDLDSDPQCARRHSTLALTLSIVAHGERALVYAVMNGEWYYQQPQQNGRQQYQTATPPSRGSDDAVHDAHSLLGAYPFASATPSSHGQRDSCSEYVQMLNICSVARHIGGLSLTAAPPSYYIQPATTVYNQQYASAAPSYGSQVSEYSQELQHLSSANTPYDDGGYWEAERNNAVRYLGEQASYVVCASLGHARLICCRTYSYDYSNQWNNGYVDSSTYQTTPFAHSVFQKTTPSAAYPTPPPAMNASSSSLAMALQEPVPKKKPAPKAYKAEDSAGFFNNFLSQQTAELKKPKVETKPVERTPRKPARVHASASPDPLALTPARKRKAAQALESPSIKRSVLAQNGSATSTPRGASEARRSPSTNITPTPRMKLEPYLALPPVPRAYQTPSQKGKGKMREESDDDLGGFGDDFDDSPTKRRYNAVTDSVKSSGKRATGDRDDRGDYMRLVCHD